jgi:hypothetical protein
MTTRRLGSRRKSAPRRAAGAFLECTWRKKTLLHPASKQKPATQRSVLSLLLFCLSDWLILRLSLSLSLSTKRNNLDG